MNDVTPLMCDADKAAELVGIGKTTLNTLRRIRCGRLGVECGT